MVRGAEAPNLALPGLDFFDIEELKIKNLKVYIEQLSEAHWFLKN